MHGVFERGETVVTGPYSDHYGSWLSAYAPIRDRRGRVVALLEADYRAGEVVASIASEAAVFAGGALAFLVVIGLASSRLAGRFARPLAGATPRHRSGGRRRASDVSGTASGSVRSTATSRRRPKRLVLRPVTE